MDELVLLIIVGVFIWLVVFVMRSSTKEKTPKDPATTEVVSTETKEQVTVRYRVQKYTTLYEYESLEDSIRCEMCDGENRSDAKTCCICGSNLISDGGNEDVL